MIGVFFVVVFSVITTVWLGQGVGTFLLLVWVLAVWLCCLWPERAR